MPLHVSSTVVLIIRRSELYYTACGIITPVGDRPVHGLREDSTLSATFRVWWCIIQGGAKRTHVFQIIVTLFIFNIKKIILTPKQPVINSVLIIYIYYSIKENYRVAQKERIAFRWCPLVPTLTRFICLRFLSLGVTSNQIKSPRSKTSYSLTIWKFQFPKKLQLCHKKCQ